MSKKLKLKLIKTRESYTTRKLSEVLGVHIRTVQEWRKQGLMPIENTIPLLFMGFEIKKFLEQKLKTKRIKLQDDQFYCVKCRKAVSSKDNKVQIINTGKVIGKNNLKELIVKGTCVNCNCILNRFSHEEKLKALQSAFIITNMEDLNNE